MNIKAHVWKPCLNAITTKTFDVEQIGGTRTFKTHIDSDGNHEYFGLYKGIYFTIGKFSENKVERVNARLIELNICDDDGMLYNFLSDYPDYIVLKVIELSGDDIKPYIEKRKVILDERRKESERRDEERRERDEAFRQKEEKEFNEMIERVEKCILNDELALASEIVEYAKHKGIKIHPRTLGSISKNNAGMELSSNRIRFFNKGTRKNTMISYTEMVEMIKNEII